MSGQWHVREKIHTLRVELHESGFFLSKGGNQYELEGKRQSLPSTLMDSPSPQL